MTEYSQNQNNPSGIWQHIWVTLTMQALEEHKQKRYVACWETLQQLKVEIPDECEAETQEHFDKIEKILSHKFSGYSQENAEEKRTAYIHKEMPKPLLELMGAIRTSLFKNGWINKSFGAKPKFSGGGTL